MHPLVLTHIAAYLRVLSCPYKSYIFNLKAWPFANGDRVTLSCFDLPDTAYSSSGVDIAAP